MEHPCQKCGACCASYRVSFHWLWAHPQTLNSVPLSFVENIQSESPSMKGTLNKHNPKCTALKGHIGDSVSCSIYESRPTPCRLFKASYEDGRPYPRCDEARARHGLKPLTLKDWQSSKTQEFNM